MLVLLVGSRPGKITRLAEALPRRNVDQTRIYARG